MSIKQDLFSQAKRTRAYNEVRIDDNSDRYNKAWLYFMAQLPANIEPPTQDQIDRGEVPAMEYVEPVVRNAVAGLTPQILDIFTENDEQAVAFRDHSFKPNPIMQEIINAQINRTVLTENDGYRVLENALKETLISGDCFTKIYIDEKHENDKIVLNDWSDLETVIGSLAEKQWQCDLPEGIGAGQKKGSDKGIEWRTTEKPTDDGMGNQGEPQMTIELKGTLPIYKITKKLVLENVGLRDLIIDTSCGDDFSKCRYICHKMNMTVGEAIDLGYKASALKSADSTSRLADAPYNKWNLVTNNQIGTTLESDWEDNGDPLERTITIYEECFYSSIPSNGKESKLYQVHSTDTELLDYHEIKSMPWVHGQVDTVPESFWGRSMYDIFAPYQDIESKMQRLSLKNAFNATYNKILVTKGEYNAESVVNSNRPGAIIEQKTAGGVQPYPFQDLPTSFGVALQTLQTSRNETMGSMVGNITTEQGVSENMAAQTVSMILAQEQMKSKVTAKTFARTYIKPLYIKIYEVYKENGMSITIPAGTKFQSMEQPLPQDTTVTSDQFPDLFDFIIDINTNGDNAMEARQVAGTLQMVAAINPQMAQQGLYKVADEQLKLVGRSASEFFPDPSQAQPDPEQEEIKRVQKEASLVQLQLLNAQVAKQVSDVALNETKMQTLLQDSQVKNQIALGESMSKIQKEAADARNDINKTALDAVAVQAEIEQGAADVTTKRIQAVSKRFNGIPNS